MGKCNLQSYQSNHSTCHIAWLTNDFVELLLKHGAGAAEECADAWGKISAIGVFSTTAGQVRADTCRVTYLSLREKNYLKGRTMLVINEKGTRPYFMQDKPSRSQHYYPLWG